MLNVELAHNSVFFIGNPMTSAILIFFTDVMNRIFFVTFVTVKSVKIMCNIL